MPQPSHLCARSASVMLGIPAHVSKSCQRVLELDSEIPYNNPPSGLPVTKAGWVQQTNSVGRIFH
jgi:hypothetical protein